MYELPPWDDLYLEIGRATQLHVRLDGALRNVFMDLAAPSAAMYIVNQSSSTSATAKTCQTMLSNAPVPDEVKVAGLTALRGALDANEQRNQVVHDMWLANLDNDPLNAAEWSVLRPDKKSFGHRSGGTKTIQSVSNACIQLLRASYRVSSLHWALHATLPFYAPLRSTAAWPLEDEIAVMEDRFDLREDGGIRPHTDNWPQ